MCTVVFDVTLYFSLYLTSDCNAMFSFSQLQRQSLRFVRLFSYLLYGSSSCGSVESKFKFSLFHFFFHGCCLNLLCYFIVAPHIFLHHSSFSLLSKMTATWNHRPDKRLRRHYLIWQAEMHLQSCIDFTAETWGAYNFFVNWWFGSIRFWHEKICHYHFLFGQNFIINVISFHFIFIL